MRQWANGGAKCDAGVLFFPPPPVRPLTLAALFLRQRLRRQNGKVFGSLHCLSVMVIALDLCTVFVVACVGLSHTSVHSAGRVLKVITMTVYRFIYQTLFYRNSHQLALIGGMAWGFEYLNRECAHSIYTSMNEGVCRLPHALCARHTHIHHPPPLLSATQKMQHELRRQVTDMRAAEGETSTWNHTIHHSISSTKPEYDISPHTPLPPPPHIVPRTPHPITLPSFPTQELRAGHWRAALPAQAGRVRPSRLYAIKKSKAKTKHRIGRLRGTCLWREAK